MKTKDVPAFKQKIMDMLPITQAEVWKTLGINCRDGSELIEIMLKEDLIKKTRLKKTFLIEAKNGHRTKEKLKSESEFYILLSNTGEFSPCCGCVVECNPPRCILLDRWLL